MNTLPFHIASQYILALLMPHGLLSSQSDLTAQ